MTNSFCDVSHKSLQKWVWLCLLFCTDAMYMWHWLFVVCSRFCKIDHLSVKRGLQELVCWGWLIFSSSVYEKGNRGHWLLQMYRVLNVLECTGNAWSRERGTSQDTHLLLCILTFIKLSNHYTPCSNFVLCKRISLLHNSEFLSFHKLFSTSIIFECNVQQYLRNFLVPRFRHYSGASNFLWSVFHSPSKILILTRIDSSFWCSCHFSITKSSSHP